MHKDAFFTDVYLSVLTCSPSISHGMGSLRLFRKENNLRTFLPWGLLFLLVWFNGKTLNVHSDFSRDCSHFKA